MLKFNYGRKPAIMVRLWAALMDVGPPPASTHARFDYAANFPSPLLSIYPISSIPYTRRCIYALILLFGGKNCRGGFSFRIVVSPGILNTTNTLGAIRRRRVDREKPIRTGSNCRCQLSKEIKGRNLEKSRNPIILERIYLFRKKL